MTKKILLLLFTISILSIMFMSCKKFPTGTTIQGTSAKAYISIDPILGQDYKLSVIASGGSITIGITNSNKANGEVGEAETIDKLYQETGSSNYSFQNGVMSGNLSILSEKQIKISFVRNTPPYLSVRDVICTQ